MFISVASNRERVRHPWTPSARWLIVVTIAGIAVGCATVARDRAEVKQELQRVFTECRTQARGQGNAAEANCAQEPVRRIYAARNYPYMDLVDLFLAHWVVLARQVDQSGLSIEAARLQLSEQLFRVTREAQLRDGQFANNRYLMMELRPPLGQSP
jgi:hypothetical protein